MTERFVMPPEVTEPMKQAAYCEYVKRSSDNFQRIGKSYIAFEDICAIFTAAFAAKEI